MNAEKLHKLLDCEIDKIGAKPELNDASLQNLYKLVDVKKDLMEIAEKEMEIEDMESGNSNRYYNYADNGNSYRRGGMSMNSGRIYARGGSSRRNYGYSMDSGSGDEMFDYLEEAMRHASSEQEREAIRQTMMKLDK